MAATKEQMNDPGRFAKSGTEHGHQVAVMVWAHHWIVQFPEIAFLHAIPNGGLRDKVAAAKLKAEGVKSGVPDLSLPVPRKQYAGMYVEIKKPDGTLSKEQKDVWIPFLLAHYYYVAVCYNWVDACKAIAWYMDMPTDGLPERFVP